MSNRNYPCQRVFGFHFAPVRLDFKMSITGSSGVFGATAGPGITSITRLAAGIYQLQLQDNYAGYLDSSFAIEANQGATAAASAGASGTVYKITSLGTTTQASWVTAGVPAGITAQVGTVFKAAAGVTAASGTGNTAAVSASNITGIQVVGHPSLMLSNQPFQSGQGGFFTFACIATLGAATATPTITDPANNTTITGSIWLNNSKDGQ